MEAALATRGGRLCTRLSDVHGSVMSGCSQAEPSGVNRWSWRSEAFQGEKKLVKTAENLHTCHSYSHCGKLHACFYC